jgi:hypothetical protein
MQQWFADLFGGKPRRELTYRSASTSDADDSAESSYEDRQQTRAKPAVRLTNQQPPTHHVTHMILEVDDYFRGCRYQGHQKALAQCFDRFAPHSPLQRYAKHDRKFAAVPHLCGLEYLFVAGGGPDIASSSSLPPEFPAIYLTQPSAARRVATDAYLVSRQLDYMYHYIIEMALMGSHRDWRIPDAMHRQRQLHRTQRMRAYAAQQCQVQHATRDQALFCPHESVLYTKRTSAFFTQCAAVLRANQLLLYHHQDDPALATPVSYNLVSFLCGPLEDASEHNQWVIVPVYFIDLWNATRLAPNNTNNTGEEPSDKT